MKNMELFMLSFAFECVLNHSVVSDSLQPHGLQPTRFLYLQSFPGKNTMVGCHFLLLGIFLIQGSNLPLLHLQADSLPLSHLRSPCPHSQYASTSCLTVHSILGTIIDYFKESISPLSYKASQDSDSPQTTSIFTTFLLRGPQRVMFLLSTSLTSSEPYPS